MKNPIKNLVLLTGAALLSFSNLGAVETDPVGFVTITVNGSPDGSATAFTPLAVSLENAVSAAGALSEDPTSAVATNSSSSYTPGEFAGVDASGNATHYLQFTADGLIVDITANDATTITAGTDLTGLASSGDGYVVKKHMTIADVFGAANSAGLRTGGNSGSSDLVYVMSSDGAGAYSIYYYQTDAFGFNGGTGWRVVGDNATDQSNVIVGPDDGIILARAVTGDIDIVVAGSVNTVDHQRTLPAGLSLVSYPFPVDVTLADSEIYTASNGYVTGGNSGSSDLVYVLQSNGNFSIYYYQTDAFGFNGGTGWRVVGDNSTDQATTAIPAGSAVIISHIGTGLEWSDVRPY